MKRITSIMLAAVLLLAVLVIPASAQDDTPAPGSGDVVIQANLGSDITTLNPLLSNDGSSNAVIARLFPGFVGVSPDTLNYAPNVPGSIVKDWAISDDGLTYTFTLREDLTWNDGTPITSADYKYAFDAINSGEVDTPLGYVLDSIADVQAPDPLTVVVTLPAPSCAVMTYISAIPVVPAHIYSAQFPTFADMNSDEAKAGFNLNPTVTAGPFMFQNFRPGEQVTLVADPNYTDNDYGGTIPQGWIYKNVATETLIFEQFLAGELTVAGAPDDRKNDMRQLGVDGQALVFETLATSVQFVSFNLADPTNPQPGLDDDGNAIDQGNHPILGDVRVRQALMHGIDWQALNLAGLGGEGIQLASHVLPSSWAFNPDIPFYEYDVAKAGELLDAAGFVDDDGDPATPRVADDTALYAAPGTPLAFELITNAGNDSNEAIGPLLQDQWKQIGVDLDFQAIEFGTLVDRLVGQTYDAVMIFWGFGFPDDPDGVRVNFDPANDIPGSGFNVASYNNPVVTDALDAALVVPGCDQEVRKELYSTVFQTLRDDVPWIWLATSIVVIGGQPYIQGWNPRPGLGTTWNVDTWFIDPNR